MIAYQTIRWFFTIGSYQIVLFDNKMNIKSYQIVIFDNKMTIQSYQIPLFNNIFTNTQA